MKYLKGSNSLNKVSSPDLKWVGQSAEAELSHDSLKHRLGLALECVVK
jgi:hypothetical protein